MRAHLRFAIAAVLVAASALPASAQQPAGELRVTVTAAGTVKSCTAPFDYTV